MGVFIIKESKYITATEGRLLTGLGRLISNSIDNYGIDERIQKKVDEAKIRTGTLTKVYPYLDKFEVRLHFNNKRVLCKKLHLFGGELLDLYTPNIDRWDFDDNLKERYGVPRGGLHCVVLSINDDDSDEDLLLGFYQNEELVGLNPATPGNLKLVTRGGTNQFWIKFGYDGLDLRLPSRLKTQIGEIGTEMEEVEYSDKGAVYTKEEIDKMFEDLRTELNLDNKETGE